MPSDHINRKTAETILKAFDFAKYIGKPLNQYAVLRLPDVTLEEAEMSFRKVRHKCRVWLQRRQTQADMPIDRPLYVYSFENPENGGLHVNWVVHIPEGLQKEFRAKLFTWVKKAQGRAIEESDIHVQDVNPFEDKTLAKYILKGVDPAYIEYLHLQRVAKPQGPIAGRRAGASVAINKAARDRVNFVPRHHRHTWQHSPWAQRYRQAAAQ
jgi:hypothetical protein|tara:strand:+ start:1418 stop:2050 length:633 start_codon:yes stop_codon:yes gene_type:complete